MEKTDITIIGAGVIGLAIAQEISKKDLNVIVVEKYPTFGQETSSRHSEVIHSGIYYPKDSLKAKLCIEGKELLYKYCEEKKIPYKKLGKLIVAINNKETEDLGELLIHGKDNGLKDLSLIDKNEIKRLEPNICAISAISSPSTGILDTHQFMKSLELSAKDKGIMFAYGCEVIGIEKETTGYSMHIRDADGQDVTLATRILINSAGLHSDSVSRMTGLDRSDYNLVYCKGQYFRVVPKKSCMINRLIYPTPNLEEGTLGIHATPDLTGSVRLGPDSQYIKKELSNVVLSYGVDEAKKGYFCDSVRSFLPFVEPEDLTPDTAGIRPKLHGPGEAFKDFIIKHEDDSNFPNLINLIGIESPGLTCSLSIARYVKDIIKNL